MPSFIILDTGPLSNSVVAPAKRGKPPTLSQQCRQWITEQALDADVILCAQTLSLGLAPSDFVVATTNPGHLAQFVPCEEWTKITP